jgi:hypothetical protein
MSETLMFVLFYVVCPGLFVGGMCFGMKLQLKQDALQSLLAKPSGEWQMAVFKAKIESEER